MNHLVVAPQVSVTISGGMMCLTFSVGLGGGEGGFAWGQFSMNHLDVAPQVSVTISGCMVCLTFTLGLRGGGGGLCLGTVQYEPP